jgi:transposase
MAWRKTGDRQDDHLHIHGSKVIVLSVTCFTCHLFYRELNVFCSDGAVAIDNNASEREMKRVVLNRKNSLFVGNPRGGRTAAILASLTSTCRRHEIDPQLYFTQLLFNLPTTQPSELSAWLPDQWKHNQSASTTPA